MDPASLVLSLMFLAPAQARGSFVLSVSARPSAVGLSEAVTLVITLRNRSDSPRFVHRDIARELDFAVRHADGEVVRTFAHPPLPPPLAAHVADWVRVDGRSSLRCVLDVPMRRLGIRRAGLFSINGFWSGESSGSPSASRDDSLSSEFEHAETTYVTVIDAKAASLDRPPTTLSDERYSACSAIANQSAHAD